MIKNGHKWKRLYHFTDKTNIISIEERGILSKFLLEEFNMLDSIRCGGNECSHGLDKEKNIHRYVSLSLTDQHPMLYVAREENRIFEPCIIKISSDILKVEGIKIAFGIANAANVKIFNLEECINFINTDVLYKHSDWSDSFIQEQLKEAKKIEILIPYIVDNEFIEITD